MWKIQVSAGEVVKASQEEVAMRFAQASSGKPPNISTAQLVQMPGWIMLDRSGTCELVIKEPDPWP